MTAKDFLFSLPDKVNKDAVEGLETLFHFDFGGEEGKYTLLLNDGVLTASEGHNGEAKCKVNSSEENFIKLVKGDLNPMMALLTGKLKISNQGEMLKYAKIFGLM